MYFGIRDFFLKYILHSTFIFFLAFSLIVLGFLLTSSTSFALDNFSNQPIPVFDMSLSNYTNGFELVSSIFYASSSVDFTFVFRTYDYLVYCSPSSGYGYIKSSLNDISPSSFLINKSSDYNLLYGTTSYNRSYSYDVPYFDSLSLGLSAVRDYIDNGVSSLPNDGYNSSFSLPAGNVAYIRVNGGDLELQADFPEYSAVFGTTPWKSESTISYGVSSLPSSGTTFPLSGSQTIPWIKRAGGQDLLGRTKLAGYPKSDLSTSDNYIVIYNPANRQISQSGQGDVSPTILCSFTKLVDVKVYPLTQSINISTSGVDVTSGSIDDFESDYSAVPVEDGSVVFVPSSDNLPSQPQIGGSGSTGSVGSFSVTDYLNQIEQTLSNFANSFISLLKAPISHVQNLINAGKDYFGVVKGLYAWLPDSVQGILESAMVVSISIGVIGLLL